MNRIDEIELRLSEIRSQLKTTGNTLTDEQLTALETETNALIEERKALKDAAEKRAGLLNKIAGGMGTVIRKDQQEPETEDDPTNRMEYRKAFMAYVQSGKKIPAELRAAGPSKTTDNGAVIPTVILNKIISKMEDVGMILPLITRTAYKGGVAIPASAVKPVATWVAEGATSEKQKVTTGSVTFAYHKLRCAVSTTLELATTSIPVFETTLINAVAEAMTKALEEAIINGDGTGKPKGILQETPEGGQKIEASALSYEILVNAEGALPQAYEAGAVWCMSKKTFMGFEGLVDTNDRPIAITNYGIAGKPERVLLGRPVVCCDYLPALTAAGTGQAYAFIFRFKDYVLNTNLDMTIKRYEDNDTDDLVTKAIVLADGKTVDKNSLVVLCKAAA